ncbi:MAG: hypothetical protein Q8N10_15280 [Phenylobacterium sp.]|uniref:hypothetical protein n=1 Tax=Phenylobacterium sp. TaxID=1871053 RepID=UPI00272B5CA6|nr:hypothetical protein [Phenylobacterium sp.]MDP3101849.1 hypothetical protein [Phenylobacterium sp.]
MAWPGAAQVDSVLRRLGMFKFLRTKLTLLYAALFGMTLILISVAVFSAISSAAQPLNELLVFMRDDEARRRTYG